MIGEELLEDHDILEPCEHAKAQLESHGSERGLNLSKIKAKENGLCVWCGVVLEGLKRRWCSERCARSASFYCFPQSPGPKIHRFIFTQQCACASCGVSFELEIKEMIKKEYGRLNRLGSWGYQHDGRFRERVEGDPERKVSLYKLGYGTGDKWQTDHIIPVHKGGKGIDPKNLQVLCVPCHKRKTKEDLKNETDHSNRR